MNDELETLYLFETLLAAAIKKALVPVETIADCYFLLDVPENTPFREVQLAYRHKLYEYNLIGVDPGTNLYFYRSTMLPKVKDAYMKICKSRKKDPQQGLVETKDSLLKERDEMITRLRYKRPGPIRNLSNRN